MENEQNKSLLEMYAVPILVAFVGLGALSLQFGKTGGQSVALSETEYGALAEQITPKEGVELPVVWGDMGKRLIDAGVIDEREFEKLYAARGGLTAQEKQLLSGSNNRKIVITNENAGTILNLLWAFGLANKNPILEDKTEMMNPAYGGAGNFASTGGWTLSRGDAMDHYGAHALVALTPQQLGLVGRVSKGIFRPCCDNSTHFPDCNHGMAMLGLLELMAAQGASEEEMYKAALQVNAYWFPDTYQTIARYLEQQGRDWKTADPKELLGANYSSASGYQNIVSKVKPVEGGGASCGV